MKRKPKSLILFSAAIEDRIWREMLTGVKSRADRIAGCQLRIVSPDFLAAVLREDHRQIDGVIGYLPDRNVLSLLRKRKIPAVATVDLLPHPGVPLVCQDDVKIGRLAAEECLRRGFVNFATYGVETHEFARARERGFTESVTETLPGARIAHYRRMRGYAPSHLHAMPPQTDFGLARWLTRLSKPLVVFALNDYFGAHLMQVCARNDLRVPDEIAVLGADDDPLWCELSDPPLASVRTLGAPIGCTAANLLMRSLDGERISSGSIRLPPLGLTLRRSLDILAIDDLAVARALAFLRNNAHSDIGVKHILAAAHPLSRRTLEIKFKNLLGHGPGAELLRVRIEHARTLLSDPSISVGAVAESCGLKGLKRFSCLFSRKTGMSPSVFRCACRQRL